MAGPNRSISMLKRLVFAKFKMYFDQKFNRMRGLVVLVVLVLILMCVVALALVPVPSTGTLALSEGLHRPRSLPTR